MKTNNLKINICILIFTGVFRSPPVFAADQLEMLAKTGIENLYKNQKCDQTPCLSENEFDSLIKDAAEFKMSFNDTLNSNLEPPKAEIADVLGEVFKKSVSFPSLLQREPGHPSNTVRGFLYVPRDIEENKIKKPATLLIHKISNNIRNELLIASMAAGQNRGSVMIIFLPNYGPRMKPNSNESFITENPEAFRKNIMQALLDIHQAYQVLAGLPYVDSHNIGLAGFSLGGIVTLMSAGIDPVFDRYLTVVGGGDLAYAMSYKYRKPEDTGSETAQALKNVTWKTDEARKFLSQFDPITWAANVKGKKIIMINALDDELLDSNLSIHKLFDIYKINNPAAVLHTYGGGHVVDLFKIGFTKSVQQIISPLFTFLSGQK